MAMYDSLGSLMRQTLKAYKECDPQLLLQHLLAGDAGTWLLQKCQAAQRDLYSTTAVEAQRANLWSELKYETLFPNYTKMADGETIRQLNFHLRTQESLVDSALRAANLGDDWNPENETPYSQE